VTAGWGHAGRAGVSTQQTVPPGRRPRRSCRRATGEMTNVGTACRTVTPAIAVVHGLVLPALPSPAPAARCRRARSGRESIDACVDSSSALPLWWTSDLQHLHASSPSGRLRAARGRTGFRNRQPDRQPVRNAVGSRDRARSPPVPAHAHRVVTPAASSVDRPRPANHRITVTSGWRGWCRLTVGLRQLVHLVLLSVLLRTTIADCLKWAFPLVPFQLCPGRLLCFGKVAKVLQPDTFLSTKGTVPSQ
jgi:hypothetical protein